MAVAGHSSHGARAICVLVLVRDTVRAAASVVGRLSLSASSRRRQVRCSETAKRLPAAIRKHTRPRWPDFLMVRPYCKHRPLESAAPSGAQRERKSKNKNCNARARSTLYALRAHKYNKCVHNVHSSQTNKIETRRAALAAPAPCTRASSPGCQAGGAFCARAAAATRLPMPAIIFVFVSAPLARQRVRPAK